MVRLTVSLLLVAAFQHNAARAFVARSRGSAAPAAARTALSSSNGPPSNIATFQPNELVTDNTGTPLEKPLPATTPGVTTSPPPMSTEQAAPAATPPPPAAAMAPPAPQAPPAPPAPQAPPMPPPAPQAPAATAPPRPVNSYSNWWDHAGTFDPSQLTTQGAFQTFTDRQQQLSAGSKPHYVGPTATVASPRNLLPATPGTPPTSGNRLTPVRTPETPPPPPTQAGPATGTTAHESEMTVRSSRTSSYQAVKYDNWWDSAGNYDPSKLTTTGAFLTFTERSRGY